MELYDIIEAINVAVKHENKGHYILHKSMQQQSIKIYKKFLYKLYLVKGTEKKLILTHQHITQVPNIDIEKIWKEEDKQFLVQLLTWLKYGELTNESIPDINN